MMSQFKLHYQHLLHIIEENSEANIAATHISECRQNKTELFQGALYNAVMSGDANSLIYMLTGNKADR